jgi:hypothetical protein
MPYMTEGKNKCLRRAGSLELVYEEQYVERITSDCSGEPMPQSMSELEGRCMKTLY